jgi:Flp pilus assembly protein TadD
VGCFWRKAALYGEALDFQRLPQAVEWWAAAATNYAHSPEVMRGLALHWHGQTNWPAARVAAERLRQLRPDDLEGRYLLGKSLANLREWPAAEAAFGPLLSQSAAHTNWTDLPALAGGTLFQAGKNAEALGPLTTALTLDYWDLEARRYRAEILTRLGREQEAVLEWQRLGQLRASRAQNRFDEARQAANRRDTELARRKLEEAYALDPWEPSVVALLARTRAERGQLKEAIALVESHLAWDRDRDWAVGFLGQLYGQAGDEPKARSLLLRYRALTGKDWMGFGE